MKNILFFLIIFYFSSFYSYGNDFKSHRVKAVELIKDGFKKKEPRLIHKGIKIMESLTQKGDLESMFALGRIYLSGKTVDKNISVSYKWFTLAARECHEKSLKVLDKIFLNRKGSKFFSPLEYNKLIVSCDNKPGVGKTVKKQEEKKIKQVSLNDWYNNQSKVKLSGLKFVSAGSGFAINNKGYFLTNRHVIEYCPILVIGYNNYLNYGKVIKKSGTMDAALLQAESSTPYFVYFDPNSYKVGEKLFAAGFPAIVEATTEDFLMSLTEGNITNSKIIETDKDKLMLVSIPISSGNSGGPVINRYGLLRGMSTGGYDENKIKKDIFNDKIILGGMKLNIMVPSSKLKKWLDGFVIRVDERNRNIKMDSEQVGEVANKVVSIIRCYKK